MHPFGYSVPTVLDEPPRVLEQQGDLSRCTGHAQVVAAVRAAAVALDGSGDPS